MARRRDRLAGIATFLLALSLPGHAAPVAYAFTSLGSPVEQRSGAEVTASQRLFPATLAVAGTFTYSTDAEYLGGQISGRPWYGDFDLQLAADGAPFTSSAFYAVIGDQFCGAPPTTAGMPPPPAVDCLLLLISRTPYATSPLLGPERTDGEGRRFGLIDVSIGWIEGRGGTTAFLNGVDVPSGLPPAGTGDPTLLLAFREIDAPAGQTPLRHNVSFDAVQVAVVPIPGSGWLLGAAIAVIARPRTLRRRRGEPR